MLMSVYLHQEYYDYLSCYGNIEEVTNRILEAARDLDIESMPNAPSRTGAKRLNINVTSEWYLEELCARPVNSPLYSVRKILYYAVDNELPTVWGWKVSKDYRNKKEDRIRKHLDNAISNLEHAQLLMSNDMREQVQSIVEQTKYIRSQYK